MLHISITDTKEGTITEVKSTDNEILLATFLSCITKNPDVYGTIRRAVSLQLLGREQEDTYIDYDIVDKTFSEVVYAETLPLVKELLRIK